jgi:hypothetical protein
MTVIADVGHPTHPVNLNGWKFQVSDLTNNRTVFEIPMSDNSFLEQPQKMQLNWLHSVTGVRSRLMRISITFQDIKEDRIALERAQFEDVISSTSFPLGYYDEKGYHYTGPFSNFQTTLPSTVNMDSTLSQMELAEREHQWT